VVVQVVYDGDKSEFG